MTTQIPEMSISDLRQEIAGRVVTADDADYDQARTVTYGDVDNRPAAIIKVANAADVVRAIARGPRDRRRARSPERRPQRRRPQHDRWRHRHRRLAT